MAFIAKEMLGKGVQKKASEQPEAFFLAIDYRSYFIAVRAKGGPFRCCLIAF